MRVRISFGNDYRYSCYLCLVVTLISFTTGGLGQSTDSRRSQSAISTPALASQAADYRIGPRDVLSITIVDSPELGGKFRVTDTGNVQLPSLSAPIKAEGLTGVQLSRTIAEALKSAQLLQEPIVSVFVEEYHSRTVTVLGAVQKPSVYSLEKPTTVLEALSMAGGVTPTAGRTLTIVRKTQGPSSAETSEAIPPPPPSQTTVMIDLAKLLAGIDPSLNVEVQPDDVLSVSPAPVIYVVGAVTKPGAFVIQDPNFGVTVMKALAMAEGVKPIASSKSSIILRRLAGEKQPREIPIDIAKLMAHKIPDVPMDSNDILFIPESSLKKNMRAMAQTAQSALAGIATYGVGYRIAK